MDNIQAMIDGMSAHWQKERAEQQMTLGELIKSLESLSEGAEIEGFGAPHSYRGYYCDLAFERMPGIILAKDALFMCKECMGKVFEGYKGGDFMMGANTPLWIANYGDCGDRLMSINEVGKVITAPDE